LTDIFSNKLLLHIDSPDADLLSTGILDSMTLVELLLNIEQEFCIRVKFGRDDLDNFRSISSIAAMLGDPPSLSAASGN